MTSHPESYQDFRFLWGQFGKIAGWVQEPVESGGLGVEEGIVFSDAAVVPLLDQLQHRLRMHNRRFEEYSTRSENLWRLRPEGVEIAPAWTRRLPRPLISGAGRGRDGLEPRDGCGLIVEQEDIARDALPFPRHQRIRMGLRQHVPPLPLGEPITVAAITLLVGKGIEVRD
jgi:hypothetical protein